MDQNKKLGFFGRPFEFSFKDAIAGVMVSSFMYITWRAMANAQSLEVMKSWISLIMVVLTGYFGQEAVTAYFVGKNAQPNIYSGSPYQQPSNTVVTAPVQETVVDPSENAQG